VRNLLGGKAIALGIILSMSACSEPEPKGPDVVLISLDSVRADFLTFLDPATAPNLTKLAERGTVFTQAISGTSWTLPSHLQMFTGMPPVLHGVQESDQRLDPKIETLPRVLSNAGYRTAGFYTCWYLAPQYGFGDGFDLYRNSMSGGGQLDETLKSALSGDDDLASRRDAFQNSLPSDKYVNSRTVVRNAREALAEMGTDDPIFLFAHLFDPHFDYIPPAPFDNAFDPEYTGTMTGEKFWSNPAIYDASKRPARQINDRDLDHIRALYRGEIAWVDAAIGDLIDDLEQRGKLDNTLIIVTADHGEEFFEHDERGHRQTLYDEVVRVPLLVVPPRGTAALAGQRNDQVGLSDLLPTIVDYAGAPVAQPLFGQSLRQAIENGQDISQPQITSLAVPMNDSKRGRGRGLMDSVRTPTHKLTRFWVQFEEDVEPSLLNLQYFDLRSDPDEQAAVMTLDSKPARQAWRQIENEMDRVRKFWSARSKTPPSELFTELESLVGRDLADLGYASSGEEGDSESHNRDQRLGIAPLAPSRLSGGKKQ
jgi:arylsulfatase A-like enzyme